MQSLRRGCNRIATDLAVNNARTLKPRTAAQNVYLDAPDEETGTTPWK